jgi:hypothetical protein
LADNAPRRFTAIVPTAFIRGMALPANARRERSDSRRYVAAMSLAITP